MKLLMLALVTAVPTQIQGFISIALNMPESQHIWGAFVKGVGNHKTPSMHLFLACWKHLLSTLSAVSPISSSLFITLV